MPFTRKEFRRLNKFDKIYILVSGGRDSTYAVLKFMEHLYWIKKPVVLLYTNTGNAMPSALSTLNALSQAIIELNAKLPLKRHWSYLELDAKAILPEKPMFYIKQAFMNLPKAWEILRDTPDKYSKKIFPCCWYLKHKIFEYWIKQNSFDKEEMKGVFSSCIRPGESLYRMRWLSIKLKRANTHFWFLKRIKVWYYYPLRDTGVAEVDSFLQQGEEFSFIPHSGCKVCPILVLFNIESEGDRYRHSVRMYENMIRKGLVENIWE